ncbi:SIMPL domain-containing protein [Methylopila henanensis]|uniref:SIMPL domain-containing protein n=1 Tax=Methylopila henanensis TaxID=873516 RepID=A0ABW4K748_9HYPH
MRAASLFAAAIAAAVAAGAARAEPAHGPHARPATISVTGEGSVSVAPDLAVVTSGVVTRAPTAAAALKANAAAMTKVIAALKAAKIEDRDVGTSGVSVQPQYDYGENRAPKLSGYEVRNTVTIRARDLDALGGLLDSLVESGSNQIEGLAFDVSDKDKRLDEARRAAVKDARRKAELYAEGLQVTLGEPLTVEERGSPEAAPPAPVFMRAKAMDSAQSTPIARGEQELRAVVSVRWSIAR